MDEITEQTIIKTAMKRAISPLSTGHDVPFDGASEAYQEFESCQQALELWNEELRRLRGQRKNVESPAESRQLWMMIEEKQFEAIQKCVVLLRNRLTLIEVIMKNKESYMIDEHLGKVEQKIIKALAKLEINPQSFPSWNGNPDAARRQLMGIVRHSHDWKAANQEREIRKTRFTALAKDRAVTENILRQAREVLDNQLSKAGV